MVLRWLALIFVFFGGMANKIVHVFHVMGFIIKSHVDFTHTFSPSLSEFIPSFQVINLLYRYLILKKNDNNKYPNSNLIQLFAPGYF